MKRVKLHWRVPVLSHVGSDAKQGLNVVRWVARRMGMKGGLEVTRTLQSLSRIKEWRAGASLHHSYISLLPDCRPP